VGFEPGLEDSYRRCGSDKIRQTVPDASSSNRKSAPDLVNSVSKNTVAARKIHSKHSDFIFITTDQYLEKLSKENKGVLNTV